MENSAYHAQIWDSKKHPAARVWDDIPAQELYTADVEKSGQALANEHGCMVRVTVKSFLPVGRRNGMYFHPKQN